MSNGGAVSESLYQKFKMIPQYNIIIRGKAYEPPLRFAESDVPIRIAEMRRLRQVEETYAIILEAVNHIRGAWGAAVANYKEFEITNGLLQDRFDRDSDDVDPRMGRH